MARSKSTHEVPEEAQTTAKVVISFRLPAELATWLRTRAAAESNSANDVVVTALEDLRTWFSASKPVAELLEADRKAFGDSTREYLQRLLQYRYDELVRGGQTVGNKPGGGPTKK